MSDDLNSSNIAVCDLCKSASNTVIYQFGPFNIRRCIECGLLWRSPQVTQEELALHYSKIEYKGDLATQRQTYLKSSRSVYERLLEELAEKLDVYEGNLLDIGCAEGWFLKVAEERGYIVWGVEVIPGMAAQAHDAFGNRVVAGAFETTDFEEKQFEVVTMLDVLEHMASPAGTLNLITRILQPNGVLVIRVPDVSGLIVRAADVLYRITLGRFRLPLWFLFRFHTYGFMFNTLHRYLADSGLETVHHYGEESTDVNMLKEKQWARNPIFRWGFQWMVMMSRVFRMPDELIVFARKSA